MRVVPFKPAGCAAPAASAARSNALPAGAEFGPSSSLARKKSSCSLLSAACNRMAGWDCCLPFAMHYLLQSMSASLKAPRSQISAPWEAGVMQVASTFQLPDAIGMVGMLCYVRPKAGCLGPRGSVSGSRTWSRVRGARPGAPRPSFGSATRAASAACTRARARSRARWASSAACAAGSSVCSNAA